MFVWDFFVVVCMGSWLWCAFIVVVFVALVGGDLFVHSSVRGACFVGFGAVLGVVLCVYFVFLWIVGVWCAMMLVVFWVYFVVFPCRCLFVVVLVVWSVGGRVRCVCQIWVSERCVWCVCMSDVRVCCVCQM